MLGFAANSDVRVTELQAALSNGIDQVLGSLSNFLIKKGLDALKNGILGDNSADNASYQSQLNSILQQQQTQYNQSIQQIQNPSYTPNYDLSGQLSQYDNFLGNNYSSGFNPPPVATTTSQGISLTDPFYTEKTNSLSIIDSILSYEAQYQNTYQTALNTLLDGKAAFGGAVTCYQNAGDATSYNRSIAINANVISNIDQTPNYSMTVPQIPWTLPYLDDSINHSNTDVAILNAAAATVTNATSNGAITNTMNTINTTNFGIDQPLANLTSSITTWLSQMDTMYNSAQCPIDLTSALSGAPVQATEASATSTVGTASSTTQ